MSDIDMLPEKVDRLADNVAVLAAAHARSRRFDRWLAASVVLDIALSFGLGYNAVRTNHAVDKANKASSAQTVQCEASNASNARNKELWDFAFGLGSDTAQTPAQAERTAKFRAFIDRTFVQEDCT